METVQKQLCWSIVVLAFLTVIASGEPSKPSLCVTPTWFIYGRPNCEGTKTLVPIYSEESLCPHDCGTLSPSLYPGNYTCGGTRVVQNLFYQSRCRGPAIYSTTATQECVNYRSGISAALVCRLNDPVYPPHSTESPTRPGDGNLQEAVQCPHPNYCTPEVPFVTYFRDHQCRGEPFSSYELHQGAALTKCYYDPVQRLNTRYECDIRDYQLVQRWYAHGCNRAEFSFTSMPIDTCILNGSTGYGMIIYCGSTSKRSQAHQRAWQSLSPSEKQELEAFAKEAHEKHGEALANPFKALQLP